MKMFRKIGSTAIVAMLLQALVCDANAYDKGDFQIWNTNTEDIRIGKATKFVMEEEFRYAENASEFFYQHYDWGFSWAFDKRLEIHPGYRLVLEKYRRKWRESDEPYVNITPRLDIWKLKFEDRNRIEYRHFRFANDQVRYRNKAAIKYPFEFKTITIAPFVGNEIFVSSNGSGFNQNRLESGIEFTLNKYAKASASYMQQQIRSGKSSDKWVMANVLWLKGRISF
jgi:hypothetical protein